MTVANSLTVLSLAASFSLIIDVYLHGPNALATQFDLQGQPVTWMNREHFVRFYLVFMLFLNGVIFGTRLLIKNPKNLRWVNIPHKEFWIRPENAPRAQALTQELLEWVLMFLNITILASILLIRTELRGSAVNYFVLGVFLGAGVLIYMSFKLFRPPRKS